MQDLNRVIAVIDDDPSVLKGLSLLLRVSGYETEVFASAEAFLQVAATSYANYLVADIHLGGMSGVELRRRLLASGATIAVILMTAVDDEALHKDVIEAGCVAVLQKPFSARMLMDAIAKATV